MNLKELLRWTVITVLGGGALYLLGQEFWELFRRAHPNWWMEAFMFVMISIVCAPMLLISYQLWRRQDRKAAVVCCCVASLIVWALIVTSPRHLEPWVLANFNEEPRIFINGAVLAATFYGSFPISQWFLRFSLALLSPHVHDAPLTSDLHASTSDLRQ